jgi:hypothetical protein
MWMTTYHSPTGWGSNGLALLYEGSVVNRLLVALAFLAAATSSAKAENYAEMAQFAQSICGDIPEGSLTRTEIQGKVQASAGVLAKIISGSADVSGSRTDEIYNGIPFDKLPDKIPTVAMCRIELIKILRTRPVSTQEPWRGWLQPANEPTPANGCDDIPIPKSMVPKETVFVIMGDTGFALLAPGMTSTAIKLGACPLVSMKLGDNGLAVDAAIYDETGTLLGTVLNNGYLIPKTEGLIVEHSGDLSTLVVHDRNSKELLYVQYLNSKAIKVRGIFSCPIPILRTITVTDSFIIRPGFFRHSCEVNSAIGLVVE